MKDMVYSEETLEFPQTGNVTSSGCTCANAYGSGEYIPAAFSL